jgi:acyl-CoA synthetase (AMP-forming)/AMP-acid ligase II
MEMEKDVLEIKSPWTLVYIEYVDEFIAEIKAALPPDHELRDHEIVPGIKLSRRWVFIVDDDTTGEQILIDFERKKRWKKTKFYAPTIMVFKSRDEVRERINRDHQAELEKFKEEERRGNA